MKICKQCGQSVQDVETYCPRCGGRQLVPANQYSQQNRVPQNNMNGSTIPPSTSRQPQPAPPGYRNPNYVPPQNNQNRAQQSGIPNRPVNNGAQRQNNRPPMQNPNMNGNVTPQNGFNPQMQNNIQGNEFGFQDTGMSDGFENQPKKKFGFGKSKQPKTPKQPKAHKQPKAPKQPNQNMQNMGGGVPPHIQNMQNMQNGYNQYQVDNSVVSIKDWLIIIIKMMIPIYNIIFLIGAWTGKPMNESVRNYLKLYTFVLAAILVLTLLMSTLIGAMFSSMFW